MTLAPPVVVAPVTPCTRSVTVQGQLPNATVRLYMTRKLPGAPPFTRQVGQGVAASASAAISLSPGEILEAGDRITADQSLNSDQSEALPPEDGAEVIAEPTAADLDGLYIPENLLACGTCLFVGGAYPGATVTLRVNNEPPLVRDTTSDFVRFQLPAGTRLEATDTLIASQTACGMAGGPVKLPPPVEQSRANWPVEAPRFEPAPVQCQKGVHLEGVLPGATVVLTIAGHERRACFAATRGWFGLSYRLNVNDQISVRQEFRLCELVSRTASVVVKNDRPLPPVLPGPICEGDRLVQVDGMVKEALLEFRVSRPSGQSTWRAGAPEGSARLGVPSLSGAQTLEVRQSACDGASWSWSDWSAPRRIRPLGTQWPPGIEWPLIDGGLAVGVRNLRKGSFVQIVSKKKKGAIGQAWGNGDHRIDVPLWYPLIESDVIHLRSRRCGQTVDWGDPTTVLPRRDLPPPTVADPACDCGGSVLVRDVVPGTIVEVFLKRPGGTFAAAGSARSGASEVSVDVPPLNPGAPPLQPGDQLKARQRMPYGVSSEGSVATSGALPRWAYVADKAHRICQLTQDWEPTDRPHPGNTTPIGITGTDLGISVEHNGRMYLFFGDCREAPDVTTDADPIAWTTDDDPDDLETWPLDLHWILGNDGKFRRLAVNGLPPLENFEVPTGAFSYEGRVYLFVAREKRLAPDRMIASFLAGVGDPQQNFELLQVISRTEGPLDPAQTPGRRFMLHISPVVVSNAAWPGLPSATGDGLLLFGSSNYRGTPENERTAIEVTNGNVYLAWAPLTSGTWPAAPIPRADQWMFVVGFTPAGTPIWDRLGGPRPPFPILPPDPPPPGGVPFPRLVGEISAAWYPALRRWLVAASPETRINVARFPWGPFTTSDFICAAGVADRDARNLMPGEEWCKTKVTYAPYLIPRWLKWDRSTRTATLYFTLSIHDLPNNQHRYQPQLMRSDIRC